MSTSRHNDMQRIADGLAKLEASSPEYDGNQKDAAREVIRRTVEFAIPAQNANASNVVLPNAMLDQYRAQTDGRVLGAWFISTGTVANAGPNNVTIGVTSLFANGFTNATLASATTNTVANGGTGSLAAGVAVALPANSSALGASRFTRGTIIAPFATMNSSGVALLAGTVEIDIELEGTSNADYPI